MELTIYSRNRLLNTFAHWQVPKGFADPVYNYLVHGFHPGGFFAALLANDATATIVRSHPANTVEGLKSLAQWIVSQLPGDEVWGSREVVDAWLAKPDLERRLILERLELVFTEQEELLLALGDEPTHPPHLW